MCSLSAEVLKGELRARIAEFGHLLDLLENIYPAPHAEQHASRRPNGAGTHRHTRRPGGKGRAAGNGHKDSAPAMPRKAGRSRGTQTERSADGKTKKCHGPCGRWIGVDEYPTNKDCGDGHTGTCKKCTAARQKRSYDTRVKKTAGMNPASSPPASALPEGKPHRCKCGKGFRTYLPFEVHLQTCPSAQSVEGGA
jgi:hypothetical protein